MIESGALPKVLLRDELRVTARVVGDVDTFGVGAGMRVRGAGERCCVVVPAEPVDQQSGMPSAGLVSVSREVFCSGWFAGGGGPVIAGCTGPPIT